MSWSGFGKNTADPRKKCTLCEDTGHLASECAKQPGPAPAPAPAPAPLPARLHASSVANASPASDAVKRFEKLVAYPLDPRGTKPNPAALPFRHGRSAAAAQPDPPTAGTVTSAAASRTLTAQPGPAPAPSQKSLSPTEQHERGLRIEYGTRNDPLPVRGQQLKDQQQTRTVLTNYVRITKRPKLVYVYELKIVRKRKRGANGEEYIKDKAQKKAIFDQLKLQNGYQELRTRRDYATDHDLIWATKPLFPDLNGETSTVFSASHPHTQQTISFEEVRIRYLTSIDASQSPLDLLRSSEQSADRVDDVAILIRGINAFMTQHARDEMAARRYASTAANRFFLTQGPHEKHLDPFSQPALRAFRGFSVSTRSGADQLLLNIHVGASPFLEDVSVQQLIGKFKAMRLPPRQAFNVFKRKEAVVGHSNRRFIIERVGNETLEDHMQSWTHLEAELSQRNLRYDLSNLPVYVTPKGATDSVRAADVKLHGYHAFRGAMSDDQTTRMLDFVCKLPIYNRNDLEDFGFNMLGITTDAGQDRANDFGMSVETSLLKVPARYLAPPLLRYRNDLAPIGFKEASWNLNKRQFFLPSTTLGQVMILDLHELHQWGNSPPDLRYLQTGLTTELRKLGLNGVRVTNAGSADQLVAQDSQFPDEKRLIEYIQRAGEKSSATILLVLPQKSYDTYATVKRVADLQTGRHVVCAVSDRMARNGKISPQYLANVAMKINLKGAGTNHAVEVSHLASILPSVPQPQPQDKGCDTIIVGADVAHPTGSARPGCPSIAAVVGSTDDDYLHYPGSMRLQISRQESIAELDDMVKERLIYWAVKHAGRLPANMLFYRDGVSESQYKCVRKDEIPQLKDAYRMAHEHLGGSGPVPPFKLTFIVVGKRHNTRFFTDDTCAGNSFISGLSKQEVNNRKSLEPMEEQVFQQILDERTGKPQKDRNGNDRDDWTRINHNLHPGSVVDEVITHPSSNDFFLQSHKPLQGTGRSAHYFVLTNQMALSSDELQRVTHALCYIYARATKGVSYCSPAYYADRLCDRGRAWLRDHLVGRRWVEKRPEEDVDDFRDRARNAINGGTYWGPQNSNDPRNGQKYGQPRKNPWHPNLDDIMFYL